MAQASVRPLETTQASLSARLAAATIAMLLGSFILIGVGFAQSDVIHNAAHDSRHSFAFPCH